MRLHGVLLALVLAGALALSSCSGLPQPPSGGGGTATLNLTMADAPPTNTSILSFQVTITGVQLTPSTGSAVSLNLGSSNPIVELTRLQSDSAFLGSFTVPSGTFTDIKVAFANPDVVFLNQTGGTVGGTVNPCPDGAICEAKPSSAGQIAISSAPFPLTLSNGGKQGLRLDFDLNNALTSTGGNIGVNFTPTGLTVLKVASLPQTAPLDLIEDFTGIITAADQTAKTFTIHSATRGDRSASADSSTVFDNCATPDFSCVSPDRTLSVDLTLNSDGSLTAKEIDLLDGIPDNEIEGFIFSIDKVTLTTFSVVVTDKVQLASGSLITPVSVGNVVTVNLQASPTFVVDTKGLPVPATPLNLFQGATDASQLLLGQTVGVRVKSFTAASGTIPASVSVDRVRLRFTRTTGVVSATTPPSFFDLDGLPAIFGFVSPARVQVFSLQTNFDGAADVNGLSAGNIVSIRALLFNAAPPFYAAKVRKK